jgi:glycosyltransferase involved in cell wall biosynthesis
VSVVIPLLNEEESLPELASHLESVLSRVAPNNYEVLFIDDGSTDRSYDVIRDIHARNQRFRAVRFRRNYGKSAALAVGFADCKGDIVVTMDADLQDDPNEIPSLITKLDEGYDLVSGWKRKRYDPWHKTVPSKLFNAVTSSMSGIKLHDFNCGLKGYRREVIQTVQVYGEMHRYIPALAHWEGFRVTEIPVQHHARKYGSSKFGMSRFLKGFLDLLTVMFTTRYIKRPLHFFGTVGALFALVGIATDMYLVVEWMLGRTALSNRPLFLFGIALLIVGVQLISLGLLGEMIVKNGLEHQRYSIRERL